MTGKRDPEVVEGEVVDEKREPASSSSSSSTSSGERPPLTILGVRLRPQDEKRLREIGGAGIGAIRGAQAIGDFFRTLGGEKASRTPRGEASPSPASGTGDASEPRQGAQDGPSARRRRPMPGERARARRGT